MSHKSRIVFGSLIGVMLCGLVACQSSSADDPPANPPARQRGQGMRGGGGALALLRSDVVQKDLQITDDQKASIQKLQDSAREARTSLQGLSGEELQTKMAELRKGQDEKIAGILNDKQKARMKEIGIQSRGPAALTDKEVAEALKLTDDQVNKLKDLTKTLDDARAEAFQGGRGAGGANSDARDKYTKLRTETNEKMLAVLSADQKASFEKMQGAKIELPAFGGRGQGGRGQGGAGTGQGGGRRNRGNGN